MLIKAGLMALLFGVGLVAVGIHFSTPLVVIGALLGLAGTGTMLWGWVSN